MEQPYELFACTHGWHFVQIQSRDPQQKINNNNIATDPDAMKYIHSEEALVVPEGGMSPPTISARSIPQEEPVEGNVELRRAARERRPKQL